MVDIVIEILVILLDISLAVFVLSKDRYNRVNKSFCLLSVSLAVWNLKHLLIHLAPDQELALIWVRALIPSEFFIPAIFYHFVLAITRDYSRSRRTLLVLAYITSFVALGLTLSGFVIQGVEHIYNGYFPIAAGGGGYILYFLFALLGVYGIYLLYRHYRITTNTKEKHRIGYLGLASVFGGIAALPNLLLTTQAVRIYPSGHIGSAGFIILVAYAIVKHRLMDITVVIRKSLIYTLITGFVTAVFLVNIILFGHLFQSLTGFSSLAPSIIAAVVIAFFFQPLREKIQLMVDKAFFRERYDQQQAIRDFSQCMVSILDRQKLVDSISYIISSTMHVEQINILIHDKANSEYVTITKNPMVVGRTKRVAFKETQSLVRWLKAERLPLIRSHIPEYMIELNFLWNYEEIERELQELQAELCIPLMLGMRLVGILSLGKKLSEDTYNRQDIELLTVLGSEAAIALENANLYQETKDHLLNTVRALSAAVEAKDVYTRGHCERVVGYAVQMARRLNLSPKEVEAIVIGATLHDIGKIGINEEILLKPARLDELEFNVVRAHPLTGAKILKAVDLPQEVMDIVKYHHERYDGQGYPYGLVKDSIPLVARILSVADAYEAMTSDRIYRPALSKQKALQILRQESGRQFDPQIVRIFTSILEEEKKES
jgi:putative nucleotidyltransferase with HDIG domain